MYPIVFLAEINDYYQFQNISDLFKINNIRKWMRRRRMTDGAKQWLNALMPLPHTFL